MSEQETVYFRPGDKIVCLKGRVFGGAIKTAHVRGVVDDCVVYRYWLRRKQRWLYQVDNIHLMELFLRDGLIRIDRTPQK